MKLFGLVGQKLGHSFSKQYFNDKFEREGLKDCWYQNFELDHPDQIGELIKKKDLKGFNITIPYKESIVRYLDHADDMVSAIKSCNCVKVINGNLYGYNTDVIGFEKALFSFIGDKKGDAIVLGTGGASKAVTYVLDKAGINYVLVSRNRPGILSYEQLTREIIEKHKIIINTTPLGMYPNEMGLPDINYSYLGKEHYCYDLIYNPAKTKFLQRAEEQGAKISNGEEMLKIQADESWRIWNEG